MKPSLFLGHEWLHNIHICLWQLWNILSVTYLIHFSFQCGIFYFRIFRNCIYLQRISLIFYSKKLSREETDVFRIRHSFKICFHGKLIRINQFIIYEKKNHLFGKEKWPCWISIKIRDTLYMYYNCYNCFNSKQTKELDNQLSRNPKKSKYKIDASCVKYFFKFLHLMI